MDIEAAMANDKKPLESQRVLNQAGLGKRLKAAREGMHLTEKEAAIRLHLSTNMIHLMEKEDFENGPPATFMRGYLRSYARILNIPEDEINAAIVHLESNLPQTPQPMSPPILNTRNINETHRYLRGMTYLVAAVLIVLVSMWWASHPKDTLTKMASPVTTTPAPTVNLAPVPETTPSSLQPTAPVNNAIPAQPSIDQMAQPPLTQPNPPANVAPNPPTTQAPVAAPNTPTTPVAPAAHPSNSIDDLEMAPPETEPGFENGEDN